MTTNKTTTKASFAAEASHQLAYILSALGIQDNHGATCALRAALESKGSLKVAAEALAETLRTVKIEVRASVNASKVDGGDATHWRERTAQLARQLTQANADITSLRTTSSQAVLDLSQSTLDVAFWRQRAETAESLLDSARTDIGELVVSRDHWKAQAGALAPIQADPDNTHGPRLPSGLHEHCVEDNHCTDCGLRFFDHKAERNAKRQAADDAQRARERSDRALVPKGLTAAEIKARGGTPAEDHEAEREQSLADAVSSLPADPSTWDARQIAVWNIARRELIDTDN